jgi:hypothetical protein
MIDIAEVFFVIFAFVGLGFLINWAAEVSYWKWQDWKAKKSDKD